MKTFQEIIDQNLMHDASGIKYPADWMWCEVNGVWYPSHTVEKMPEFKISVKSNHQDFIEHYYPEYYRSQLVARVNDLDKNQPTEGSIREVNEIMHELLRVSVDEFLKRNLNTELK